jgi:hypothetical protein
MCRSWSNFTQILGDGCPQTFDWAMLLLGFGGLGFMVYRRKSKPALSAARSKNQE